MKSPNRSISPNEKQRSAIQHPPSPLMIIAGAGTGKTFTIENRITYLIQHFKVDPQHILAITYTEKAAKELQNRIDFEEAKKVAEAEALKAKADAPKKEA